MKPVKMFSTASCPFCLRAKALLQKRGVVTIDEIRIDERPAERGTMIQLTQRYTMPQIFVGEVHIGGCDDLMALDAAGGLAPLLAGTP